MAQRRFHSELAFEHYLRANRLPYIAVDEAKKSLAPAALASSGTLKSFDFVVYAGDRSLLVDVKGRAYGSARSKLSTSQRRLESWVTEDDVTGLEQWHRLFGDSFEPVFVFAYCLHQQPPDALFESVFTFRGKWYALRECGLASYKRVMEQRSPRWRTVHVPRAAFERISRPFNAPPRSPAPGPLRSSPIRRRRLRVAAATPMLMT